jgi:hypothetical protein
MDIAFFFSGTIPADFCGYNRGKFAGRMGQSAPNECLPPPGAHPKGKPISFN